MASGSSSARTLQQQDHEEQQAMGYPKLEGFLTTSGPDYVVALCSLFFLRALRVSDDFFLASNYQPAGKFDNVVIFYRLREDPDPAVYRAIFLQAKVSEEEPKNKQKRKHKLPFILKDYLETFKKIRYLWDQPLNLGHRRITFKDVTLVFYTNNNKCGVDEIARDVTNHPELLDLQDFLNTGGRLLRIPEAQGAQLSQGQDSSDFLAKLLICTHQMSVETSKKFLREEIRKVLRLESSDVQRELTSELNTVMKTWWSTRGRGTFLTANCQEWQRILKMQMTRLNGDTLAVDSRMNLAFTEEALQELDVVSRRMKMTWIRVSDTHQASVTRVRLLKARSESLVLGAKYLDSHWAEVEALWGKSVCQTLVLDLTDYPQWEESQLLQRLQEAAEMDARRHLVVVATEQPPSEGWNVVEPLKTWSALKPQTQQRLMSVKVQLQGVDDVQVRDVVGSSVSDFMTDKVIESLSVSETPIRLGEAMTTPLDVVEPLET